MVEKICFYLSDFVYVCLGIFSIYALLKVKSVNEFLESVFPSLIGVLSYIVSWLATHLLKDE